MVGLKPAPCPYCQAPGAGDDPTPWRPHVIALPPIKPVVTASHGQQVVCAACGAVSRAPWPKGGPSGTAGPRGQATVALCRGASRLAKRTPHAVMAEVCGVPRRVGTISPWAQATAEARAAPGEEARTYVHAHEVAHLEETSGRQGGTPAWGGVAVTSRVTGGVVRRSRGGQVARALLGEGLRGILVTERSSASPWSPVRWRQRCWAHVLRDVAAMRGRGGAPRRLVRPGWRWRTRGVPGGIGCAQARGNARRVAPRCARFAGRWTGAETREARVVCPQPQGHAVTS